MTNKMTQPVVYLIIGLIIGAAAMWIIGRCCCGTTCTTTGGDSFVPDTAGIVRIDTSLARQYFSAYMNNPQVDTFMAFTINAQQFYIMKKIANANPNVHGFRIYMGMNNDTAVRMVVGTGSPEYTEEIYRTPAQASGPCPEICDHESPIMDGIAD